MTTHDMTPDEWEAGHEFHIEHQACPGYTPNTTFTCDHCWPEEDDE